MPTQEIDLPRCLVEPDWGQDREQSHFAGEEERRELALLAQSIRELGLQNRIVVRPHPEQAGRYQIIAGQRRFTALGILNERRIPVVIRHSSAQEAADIQLVENVARRDLDPIEEARAYQRRILSFGYSPEEVARRAGVRTERVKERLKLLLLTPELQFLVRKGQLPLLQAEKASSLDGNRQIQLLRFLNHADAQKLTPALLAAWVEQKRAEQDAESQQGFSFGEEDPIERINARLDRKNAIEHARVDESGKAYQSLVKALGDSLSRMGEEDRDKLLPVALSHRLPQVEGELSEAIKALEGLREQVRLAQAIRAGGGDLGDYVRTAGIRKSRAQRREEAQEVLQALRGEVARHRSAKARALASLTRWKGVRGSEGRQKREEAQARFSQAARALLYAQKRMGKLQESL